MFFICIQLTTITFLHLWHLNIGKITAVILSVLEYNDFCISISSVVISFSEFVVMLQANCGQVISDLLPKKSQQRGMSFKHAGLFPSSVWDIL